jgi:hypothetical protein
VEGLLNKIHTSLRDHNPFAVGDSTTLHHSNEESVTKLRFAEFMGKLEDFARGGHFPFTLQMRDPLGNSFISAQLGSFTPPEMDKNLTITDFERSYDDNEEFGLNDINTQDFETGVKYDSFVRPDRLTHITVKGADHPTFYAKGTEDSTLGGGVFVSTTEAAATGDAVVSNESLSTSTNDISITQDDDATEEERGYGKRHFNDDSALVFEAREEFGGFREGCVYRLGSQGLGYYDDVRSYKK